MRMVMPATGTTREPLTGTTRSTSRQAMTTRMVPIMTGIDEPTFLEMLPATAPEAGRKKLLRRVATMPATTADRPNTSVM